MASTVRKLFKSKHASSSTSQKTINSREIMSKITTFNQEISNDQLPHISPENIYQIGTFDFKTAYSIKEHEQTLSLQNEFEEIKLLSSMALENYKRKKFNYIHFGLIQIAIKPLSRTGIDSPILMLLRDKTLLKFEDSLLGAVQSNLCNGAIYFNCAPNFQVSLHDPTIFNTLVLNVHLPEIKFQQERHGYLLLYRIYFKQSTSEFNPRCLLQDDKGETTILAVHSKDTPTSTYTPKQLKWTEITIPDQWKINITQPPRNFEQRTITSITEQYDGKVLLKFGSFRDPPSLKISSFYPRSSFSDYRTRQDSTESEESVEQILTKNQEKKPINFQAPIAEPIQPSEAGSSNFPTSPTPSDFKSINIISKVFTIDKHYLKEEFLSHQNRDKRKWYFETFTKEKLTSFREIWYSYMEIIEINIPFFTWFETYALENKIDYPYKDKSINTSSTLSHTWEMTNGETHKSVHPPLKDIKIHTPQRQVIATPFRTGANRDDRDSINMADIKIVYEQNNYQSQILHTISRQIDHIDNKLDKDENVLLTNYQPLLPPFNTISPPLFKPLTKPIKFPENEILKSISSRLDRLDKGKGINNIDENIQSETDIEINRIKRNFQQSKKPYYPRHSPPDLLFEEHNKFPSTNFYNGEGIYEWNIDGRSEYEMMNLFQEMGMATLAYKSKGMSDKQACLLLISGFNGALKFWWDNALDITSQDSIINHTETRRVEGDDGFYEEEQVQNAVEVLLHTITMHFVGNPSEELTSKKLILTNLRCPTLGDFKWYKDIFITNIFQRNDCNQPFWKERFIAGLPSFFAERLISKLKDFSGGQPVPWDTITYGQLFAFVKKEGLQICQEHKDKQKTNKFKFGETMGSFCEQYGYHRLTPPSRERQKTRKQNKSFYPQPYNKRKRFSKRFSNSYYTKNKNPKQPNKKEKIICWNCKRPGHKSTDCKMKRKINEIFHDQQDIKEKLEKLLLSETENSEELSSDPSLDIIESESDTSTENSENYSDDICNCKTINVITKDIDKQFLIDIIDKIDDQETKKEYLLKLKDLVQRENQLLTPQPFSLNRIIEKYPSPTLFKQVTTGELQGEVKNLKAQIKELQQIVHQHQLHQLQVDARLALIEPKICQPQPITTDEPSTSNHNKHEKTEEEEYIQIINKINYQKWYTKITLHIGYDFKLETIALLDTGADYNCIREGIIPTKFYEKTYEKLSGANGSSLKVNYKLPKAKICNKNYCFKTQFILVKNLSQEVILGTPFFTQIYPFKVTELGITTKIVGEKIIFEFLSPMKTKEILALQNSTIEKSINLIDRKQKHILYLQQEIKYQQIEQQLHDPQIINKIKKLETELLAQVCSELPNAFWERKKHIVEIPYEKDFNEKNIPTKARPIQMNQELLEHCKKEIQELLDKNLIRKSKSPWSCSAFYVNNQAEKERGVPRLVINYKPLNNIIQWIRYPIPNKRDLLKRLYEACIFSKFDMKSGFWQIQIAEKDKYKTAFTVPFGHYEWNVMPFGLKNAPSEFQNIMNEIFNPYTTFSIVYIDDVLIFSKSIDQHFKHLYTFLNIVKKHGLVVSAKKMQIFQTKIRFLGHNIYQGTITPISRSIEFASKFPDEIKEKTQLQRFLGCLNYISDFLPNLRKTIQPLFQRLQKNPIPWSGLHTSLVRDIKKKVTTLPCLVIPHPNAFMIVETDASEIGYGGILKQKLPESTQESIVRFHSGIWLGPQKNYSTVKKEVLSIVNCISKFQDDLINKKFLLRVDCKSAKEILQKDVKNLVSKQIFARWQAILSVFDFDIQYIKGENNSLPDFLTREYLQGKSQDYQNE